MQTCIKAAVGQQLGMAALFDDAAAVHRHHPVGVFDG